MIEEVTKKPTKIYECNTCGWMDELNYVDDEQALFDSVECPKCGGIAKKRTVSVTNEGKQPAINM